MTVAGRRTARAGAVLVAALLLIPVPGQAARADDTSGPDAQTIAVTVPEYTGASSVGPGGSTDSSNLSNTGASFALWLAAAGVGAGALTAGGLLMLRRRDSESRPRR